jgi:hypothetical protein
MTDQAVCVCGRPIVRGAILAWTHATNPGRDHHYAKPARPLTPAPRDRSVSAMQQTTDAR